ncbi:hypothetical protein C8Q75DRAFT_454256 [Abortiporus biennis]|nr:hypothetical protein C8Q75DRAFT_454256 [Abortiporus biennis]
MILFLYFLVSLNLSFLRPLIAAQYVCIYRRDVFVAFCVSLLVFHIVFKLVVQLLLITTILNQNTVDCSSSSKFEFLIP